MTEIPEHLLKRSKERRAAMGLPGGESDAAPAAAGESAPTPAAESAPVAARAAAPVEAAPPPPPKPDAPYVAAAKQRRRIPYWAMPVIALLPIWGMLYLNSVKVPPAGDDALTLGGEVFAAKCSSCHGAVGQGGAGAQLSEGEVLKTWPDPVGQMQWIHLGGNEWTGTTGDADYGDPERPGGPHNTGIKAGPMPGFTDLSAEDLAAVTRYVRETLSGAPDESAIITPELAQQAIDDANAGDLVYKNVEPDPARIPQG